MPVSAHVRRLTTFMPALVVLVAAGCSGDGPVDESDIVPTTVLVASGNDQIALQGAALAQPVVVRAVEEAFVNGLVEFRGAEVRKVAVDEDAGVAFVEWFMDYTHKDWGDRTYNQVAAQQWEVGQIANEKFYTG